METSELTVGELEVKNDPIKEKLFELKTELQVRGEEIGFGNVLALVLLSQSVSEDKLDSIMHGSEQFSGEELMGIDLVKVKSLSEKYAISLNIEVLAITDELTVPTENLAWRTNEDVNKEIIEISKMGKSEETKDIDVYRYSDTIGNQKDGKINMDPGEIIESFTNSGSKVFACARGLRWPVASRIEARGASVVSLFTIRQMLEYPQFVLKRTEENMIKGEISESRYGDKIIREMLLSGREKLAYALQSGDWTTPYLSASLDDGGLNDWGRYRIKIRVPNNQTLNVRDLSVQYDEVLGLRSPSEEERSRAKGTLHNNVELWSVGGQQLDEVAVLGGIRKDDVVEIYDTQEKTVIWQREVLTQPIT